ncbi:MAG: hypothetical protein R2728_09665 [Chitinophagales bacterium]
MTPKEHIKNLLVLHLALLAGQLMILGMMSFFVVESITFEVNETSQLFYIIGIVAIIGGLFLSEFLFNRLKSQISPELSLSQKLEQYRSAFIVRDALREGPGLINIIFFAFIESNVIFLAGAILIILIFLLTIPSQNSIISHLNLTRSEADQLV